MTIRNELVISPSLKFRVYLLTKITGGVRRPGMKPNLIIRSEFPGTSNTVAESEAITEEHCENFRLAIGGSTEVKRKDCGMGTVASVVPG